jgi:large conductance mechanosensitive channel
MLKEFKEFIMRGSVLDLAIGVIIGSAFGKIVSSLVNDVVMPPFGMLLGKVSFTDLYINLSGTDYPSLAAAQEAGAPTLNYGIFLNSILEFIIIALVIFLIVKQVNRMTKPKVSAEPTTKTCPFCQSEIAIKATRCPNCTSEV